jgi:rSAM/selenodomain-associated transferase 1
MNTNILIIFAKNLVRGKVKTRLAASIGDNAALEIYKQLLYHTKSIAQKIDADKVVYYSESVQVFDLWNNNFSKAVQQGKDLGERMRNAFEDAFRNYHKKAVIIGTDCPSLNEQTIKDAFERLSENDIVIGPACDGGYYLLGMKKLHRCLFQNIHWSTQSVLNETQSICEGSNFSYFLLPALHDIDEEKDLIHFKRTIV